MRWLYFRGEQTRTTTYQPLIRPEDEPPIHLNRRILDQYRPAMAPYYYNPARYPSYLEQLGVKYPVLPDTSGRCDYRAP